MLEAILSHPADDESTRRRLLEHHQTVAEHGRRLADSQRATAPDGTTVSTLVDIAGFVHDLGKAHPAFQSYLRGERDDGPSHAPLGAVAAFHAARQRGLSRTDATIPLVAVARHHQRLPYTETPYVYIDDRYLDGYLDSDHANFLGRHVESIEAESACHATASETYAQASDEQGDWEQFVADLNDGTLRGEIQNAITHLGRLDPAVRSEEYYGALLQTWSTLVLADKTDAASLTLDDVQSPANPPSSRTLEKKVDGLGGDATGRGAILNELRDAAFREINGEPLGDTEGRIHEFIESDHSVGTLSLPTGLGKTYTGLASALTVRDALPTNSTIVYCLPYTSIIDQTAADIETVFGCSPTDRQFTIDHYLADTVTTLEETPDERFTRDEQLLGECWQANLVVTTFVQLFESLLGPSNSASLKLPNLTESVIILDEPQALPLGDWDRVRDAIHLLTQAYGARVILMTATQPRLFTPDDRFEPFPLVEDASTYFQPDTERVSYTFDQSMTTDGTPLDYERAATSILDGLRTQATLAICNTIPSARELTDTVASRASTLGYDLVSLAKVYDKVLGHDQTNAEDESDAVTDRTFEALLERVGDATNPLVTLHLSTRHRPIDRERLLRIADQLTQQSVPFVFVSTQLVEAGVDVSFQRVFRDFAPLDSIVQAAGRCNRDFEQDHGQVTVWQLASPSGDTPPSTAVYAQTGNDLLATTRRAIADVSNLPAEVVGGTTIADDAVERYYEFVRERMTVAESAIHDCNTRALNEYRMIDDRCLRSVEVVVCRTQADVALAERTQSAFAQRNFGTGFEYLGRLADRTVSIPVYTRDRSPVEQQSIPLGPTEQVQTRWIEADTSLFDVRDGLTNDESVEDYFL